MSTPGSRIELVAYIDHLAEVAGDRKIWLKITSAFHLSKDPGAGIALADYNPTADVLDKLCNYFNCRVEQLVEHVPDRALPVTTRKKKTASRRSR